MPITFRSTDDGYIVGTGEVVGQNEYSLLFRMDNDGTEDWYTTSQIHDDSDVKGLGDYGTLIISTWLAKQKGFL